MLGGPWGQTPGRPPCASHPGAQDRTWWVHTCSRSGHGVTRDPVSPGPCRDHTGNQWTLGLGVWFSWGMSNAGEAAVAPHRGELTWETARPMAAQARGLVLWDLALSSWVHRPLRGAPPTQPSAPGLQPLTTEPPPPERPLKCPPRHVTQACRCAHGGTCLHGLI